MYLKMPVFQVINRKFPSFYQLTEKKTQLSFDATIAWQTAFELRLFDGTLDLKSGFEAETIRTRLAFKWNNLL